MRTLSLALFLSLCGISPAFAGGIIHLLAYPGAGLPCCAYFAVNDLPYTFVTGFDPVTKNIQGVCGYTGHASGRGSRAPWAYYNCEWDLTGKPSSRGSEIAGSNLPGSLPPPPVYGPLMMLDTEPVFVVGTDSNYNNIGVLDGSPRIAVLVTP